MSKNKFSREKTRTINIDVRGMTKTGMVIFQFMKQKKVKGNYRDFVLFIGNKMFDNSGEYEVLRPKSEEGEKYHVALLHKKNLIDVMDEENAEKFWCYKLKKRNNSTEKRILV